MTSSGPRARSTTSELRTPFRSAADYCVPGGGYLVFTDAVWRTGNPPPEVKASFDLDYPTMGRVDDILVMIEDCGLEQISHFTLPDEAWWTDFYTPMQHRIEELRGKYNCDAEAAGILNQLAQEPEMHRRYSEYYARLEIAQRKQTSHLRIETRQHREQPLCRLMLMPFRLPNKNPSQQDSLVI